MAWRSHIIYTSPESIAHRVNSVRVFTFNLSKMLDKRFFTVLCASSNSAAISPLVFPRATSLMISCSRFVSLLRWEFGEVGIEESGFADPVILSERFGEMLQSFKSAP